LPKPSRPKAVLVMSVLFEHDAALAQKIATDIGKTGLPIARGHVRNSFVARVKLEPLTGVFGQQQHRVVV